MAPTPTRSSPFTASLALALTGLVVFAVGGCESRVSLGASCTTDDDCQSPLVCAVGGRCRVGCRVTDNCPVGERCLVDVSLGRPACSIARETCVTECAAGLECVSGECQSGCTSSDQCPDSVCTVERYCLVPPRADTDAGPIDASMLDDAGTPDASVTCGPAPQVADVSLGSGETCAVTSLGEVYCWGYFPLFEVAGTGVFDCHYGMGNCHPRPVRIPGITDAREVVLTGRSRACARLGSGHVVCWGSVDGAIDRTPREILTAAEGTPLVATRLVAGDEHVCAVSDENEVLCWGRHSRGRLGDGAGEVRTVEFATAATELAGLLDPAPGTLTAGYVTTQMLGSDGLIRGVGANESGQLGATPSAEELTSVRLARAGATFIAAADSNTCVLIGGMPQCWGYGTALLGAAPTGLIDCEPPGDMQCTTVPQALTSPMALAELTGDRVGSLMFGITTDGVVFGWGVNDTGLLGSNHVESPSAVPALGGRRAHVISVASATACAILDTNAELVCWGLNEDGQLGRGRVDPRSSEDPSLRIASPPCW